MANYKLSENAKNDLERIYQWGVHHFGEDQADRYYHDLFNAFDRIAENPMSYPKTDAKEGYRYRTMQRNTIYFRNVNEEVQIMAILGQQDTDIWL